jgi:serine/threonine protein kinase
MKSPSGFVIRPDILQKIEKDGFTLGSLLGEGMTSIAYEVYKKGDDKNRYVLKIVKTLGQGYGSEIYPLRELRELVSQIDKDAIIIKYCGESLDKKWKNEPSFMPLKEAIISLLEAVHEMHLKGWVHCDIKPDNICVVKSNGKYKLKLMDFGNSNRIPKDEPFGSYILSKYNKKYKNIKTVEDFKRENAPVEILNISNFKGNFLWPLNASISSPYGGYMRYDDVEAAAISLWSLYNNGDVPWRKYYSVKNDGSVIVKKEDRHEILKLHMNELLCPFEIIREVLREAWKGANMDLSRLIERLKNM